MRITNARKWWEQKKRNEALSGVRGERRALVDVLSRREALGMDRPPTADDYLAKLDALEARLGAAPRHDFDDIVADAEAIAELRAYFTPEKEVNDEGQLAIGQMAEWGVPKDLVASLHARLDDKLKSEDPTVSRSALNQVLAEYDSWSWFSDDYDSNTWWTAWVLLGVIVATLTAAMSLLKYPSMLVFGLLCAAIAGSATSVAQKIGPLAVTAEFQASIRGVAIRIATGVTGSMIASGLLAWGIAPIAVSDKTYPGLLENCAASPSGCSPSTTLTLVALSALFGFSERMLAWATGRLGGAE